MHADRPFLLSAVLATYNVSRYLPDLFASLEQQTYGIENVQLVFVDDGSTDGSGEALDAWAAGRDSHVTVIHQENQRVAAARNAGLAHVRGDWVTFTDPDDALDPRYFEEVAKFAQLHGSEQVALLAAHYMTFTDEGVMTDTHPSRKRFEKGSRIVDLLVDPIVQLGVNHAFFRADFITDLGLQFDHRVRPIFEDAHFVGRYLLRSKTSHVGLMASAKYLYRSRGDGSSLLHSGYDQPERYTNVLRYGELDLLRTAAALGPIPRWVENTVLYDLVWFFRNELAPRSASASAPVEVLPEFHSLAGQILELISDEAIRSFDLFRVETVVREVLRHGYEAEPYRPSYVLLGRVDEVRQLVEFSYWFTGPVPAETWMVNGVAVVPVHQTVQDYEFYGRTLMRQRHVWVPRGQVMSLDVDGGRVSVARGHQHGLPTEVTKRVLNPHIEAQRRQVKDPLQVSVPAASWAKQQLTKAVGETLSPTALRAAALSMFLRSKRVRERFAHAWVFMDRDTDANDNAEHLYRWIAREHPEINLWFVLRRDSRDWNRLAAEGFRLVEYGSREWTALMVHADHLASSHIDVYVVSPLPWRKFGQPRFRYTFLQHGVIHNDLSRWLNTKRPDVFVTTTPQEHAAIAGEGPYKFTDREVMLTGLPRHDELLRKRAEVAPEHRDLIVVMPTWRQGLLGPVIPGSNERRKNPFFKDSDYCKAFETLLGSAELRELAESSGKTVAFMPHPNMRPYLADFDVPAHVRVLDFGEDNVQDVLAHGAAFVTDYTSVAFDAAFLELPMVYFQFDAAQFFDGTHVGRRGYFRHDRDGFGPVVFSASDVVAELRDVALRGWVPAAEYLEREEAAFVARDGRNSERVFEAMRALDGVSVPRAPVQAEAQTVSQ